jgi:hypothetical protein
MRVLHTVLFRFWGSHGGGHVFWDITSYSQLKANRRFRGTFRLHFQGRISRARYCHLLSRWHLAPLILPWRWRRYVSLKCRLTFNGFYGVISQKIILFTGLITLRSEVDTWNAKSLQWRCRYCCVPVLDSVTRASLSDLWRQHRSAR